MQYFVPDVTEWIFFLVTLERAERIALAFLGIKTSNSKLEVILHSSLPPLAGKKPTVSFANRTTNS